MAADGRGRLLVVIPALNEADCIGSVIAQARERGATDVVVVDDGSTDDTAAIATLSGATVLRAPLWQAAWGAVPSRHPPGAGHASSAGINLNAASHHGAAYHA